MLRERRICVSLTTVAVNCTCVHDYFFGGLERRRLRWCGHVCRMKAERTPRQQLYADVCMFVREGEREWDGERTRGSRPHRFPYFLPSLSPPHSLFTFSLSLYVPFSLSLSLSLTLYLSLHLSLPLSPSLSLHFLSLSPALFLSLSSLVSPLSLHFLSLHFLSLYYLSLYSLSLLPLYSPSLLPLSPLVVIIIVELLVVIVVLAVIPSVS